MDPEEERALMRRVVAGDTAAFRRVMDGYMTDIYRFACSVVGDASKAEDIAQETFVRLWTKAESWAATGRLKYWLLTIAHRLCMDELRGRKPQTSLDSVEFSLRDPANDPLQALAEKENSNLVRQALLTLPERQRAALMLVHYSGLSNTETASIMEVSVDAVESLLARGKQGMKTALTGTKMRRAKGGNGWTTKS